MIDSYAMQDLSERLASVASDLDEMGREAAGHLEVVDAISVASATVEDAAMAAATEGDVLLEAESAEDDD